MSEAIGPDEGTALVGDSYTMRCTAPLSHPRAQVKMFKGRTVLESGPGYTVSADTCRGMTYRLSGVKVPGVYCIPRSFFGRSYVGVGYLQSVPFKSYTFAV